MTSIYRKVYKTRHINNRKYKTGQYRIGQVKSRTARGQKNLSQREICWSNCPGREKSWACRGRAGIWVAKGKRWSSVLENGRNMGVTGTR